MNTKILITFDNGNSHPHFGQFQNGVLQKTMPFEQTLLLDFMEKEVPIVMSNVASIPAELLNYKHLTRVGQFKEDGRFLDMPMDYTSSIGDDRIVQIYYLYKTCFNHEQKIPNEKYFALIDAGTYITIDFFSKKGHHGGFIYPGVQTFLNSYDHGKNLPKLKFKFGQDSLLFEQVNTLPHNTQEALMMATNHYLQNTIIQCLLRFGPVSNLFITGGSSEHIKKIVAILGAVAKVNADLIHESLCYFYQTLSQQLEKSLPESSL